MNVRVFYAIGFLASMLILSYLLPKTRASVEDTAKALFRLLAGLIATIFFSLVQIMVPVGLGAKVVVTGYYMSMTWTIFFLLMFVIEYTGRTRIQSARYILPGLLVLDNLSTLANLRFSHMFRIESAEYRGETFAVADNIAPAFSVHAVFLYVMIGFSIYYLIRRLITAAKEYAIKYLTVIIAIAIVVAWNFFCIVLDMRVINASVFGYAIMGILLYYFTAIYVPNSLQERILSRLVDELEEGVIFLDPEGKCIYINESAERIVETQGMEKIEKDTAVHQWLYNLRIETTDDIIAMRSLDREGRTAHLEIEHQRLSDAAGNYIGSLIRLQDHTKDINDLATQRYRAMHDSLTGLLNREGFYETAESVLQGAPHVRHMMICFNFKDFKYVNSFFGMQKGDEMLINAAEELNTHLEENDVLGRLYADNYALLLPKDRFDEWRIKDYIRDFSKRIVENSYNVYIHVGIYEIVDPTMEISQMCDYANLAIDTIRSEARNRLIYYSDDMMEHVLYEKEIISEFDQALREGQIMIYLQPQFTKFGQLVGSEALVRWKHPVKGMISPGAFIPVLEENGLIFRLDRFVWEEAARLLHAWKGTDKEDQYISVNISAKDIYYLDVFETFREFKDKYQIEPSKLKLEITETAVMYDVNRYIKLVDNLHEEGFEVEMDDFGSGYSSLSMLKNIDIDILKIDMAFLQDAETKERGKKILESVIKMAKALEIPVITEGVETEEQMHLLTGMGSDMFQGYYFARPMPVSDFENTYFPKQERKN